jgi:hypothetical protein
MCMGGVGVALSTLATRSGRRWLSSRGRGAVVPRRRHGGTTMPAQAQKAGSCQQQLTKTGQLSRGKYHVGRAWSRPALLTALHESREPDKEDLVTTAVVRHCQLRSYWIPGAYAPPWSEKRTSLLQAIEKEGLQGGKGDSNWVGRPRHIHDPGIQQEPTLQQIQGGKS